MSDVTVLSIDTIVSNPKIRNGRPIIAGTTMRVQDIAVGYAYNGYSVDDLLTQYPHLNHAQILAALAYYYAHKDEIDVQIKNDDQLIGEAAHSIQRLHQYYTFRTLPPVAEFLEQHPFLVPILVEVALNIRRFFPSATLILDKFVDREDPSEAELIIVIRTEMPTEAALAALGKLDDEWWLDYMANARGKLSITVGTV